VKYSVIHSCGHAGSVTLFGPGKERDRKLAWLAKQPCRDCLADTTQERAMIQADARELPELTGSPKQIEWATRCRYHALTLLDRVLRDAEARPARIPIPEKLPGESDPRLGDLIAKLYAEDAARFWIDHGRYADIVESEQACARLLEREGIEVWPERLIALLLLAAAGVTDPPDKHLNRVMGLLRVSGAALQRRLYPATLDAHVDSALAAIRRALRGKARPYVALSGGKDSAVVRHLVERVRPDVTLFWSDDELEYPETVATMERTRAEVGGRLVIAQGWAQAVATGCPQHAGWFDPWFDRPFWRDPLPGTLVAGMDSADWMASRGHDLTFLGTRALESQARARWFESAGPVYASGTGLRCCPIWDWPTDYVYQYAEREGIALNPVYRRLQAIGVELERRRVGPLPLVSREHLVNGWPELLEALESRYGRRWND
jgi:3'-phosphoadenosine 5'-phosphosulfate sulfotransferase (PAPS reductase)/FAD synthetase